MLSTTNMLYSMQLSKNKKMFSTHPSFITFNLDFNSFWDAILWSSQTFTYNTSLNISITRQTWNVSVDLHGYAKDHAGELFISLWKNVKKVSYTVTYTWCILWCIKPPARVLKSVRSLPFSHPCRRRCSSANFSPVLFTRTISAISRITSQNLHMSTWSS